MFGRQRPSGERTAEDRARAAAERAARRAKREGGPIEPPAGEEIRAYRATPRPAEPAPDASARAARERTAPDAERSVPDTVEHAHVAPQPVPSRDGAPRLTAVDDRPPLQPPRRTTMPAARRRPPLAPRAPHAPSPWRRRILALVALVLLAAALYLTNAIFQPFHGQGSGAVKVTVPTGATVGQIGDRLERAGVIGSAFFFQLNATLTGKRGDLHPGTYTLRRGMSNGDAVAALQQGPKVRVVKIFNVTIPEGPSRREVAPLVAHSPLQGDYLKASATRAVLRRIRGLGAPRGTKTAEGFLFPATYAFYGGATAASLVEKQLAAFAHAIRRVDMRAARRKHLTRYDVLIIASMVEREAQLPRERPLIAAVIYNRLRQGMPLGIDATIRYYTNNWQRPIRVSELKADEPYNTRINRGLPPTPIGNPGLASLQAAAHPASKPYLFYVRKPGNSGEHVFSSTDAQFERDVARYQSSRSGR